MKPLLILLIALIILFFFAGAILDLIFTSMAQTFVFVYEATN